jgi:hypothetical protein
VCKKVYTHKDGSTEDSLDIYEAYYNSSGEIWGLSTNPASPYGETLEELEKDLQFLLMAVKRPIIDLESLVFAQMD